MTNEMNPIRELEERLERELDELDIPTETIDHTISVICAALELDPLSIIDRMNDPATADSLTPHEAMVATLIDDALESSAQMHDLRRAIEIGIEISEAISNEG